MRGLPMAELNMVEAIRLAMAEELERDERVMVLGIDVGRAGGIFRATQGLQERFGEARVVDTPLAESAIVGIAVGAALEGLRPIAEIQFADFILPAVNQIVSQAAKMRYRSAGDFTCPLVVRAPCGAGVRGALYHSQCVEALFLNVPGLKVVMPSTPADARGLLKAAVRDPDPVLFFEHKKLYREYREPVPEDDGMVPLGRAAVRRQGRDVSVFAYGLQAHHAVLAAETLAAEGVDAEVVDLRTLRPLDTAAVLGSARKTGRALVVYETNRFAGPGAEIAALIAEEAWEALVAPVRRLAFPELPVMPLAPPLEEHVMLTPPRIAEAVRALLAA